MSREALVWMHDGGKTRSVCVAQILRLGTLSAPNSRSSAAAMLSPTEASGIKRRLTIRMRSPRPASGTGKVRVRCHGDQECVVLVKSLVRAVFLWSE